MLSWWSSGGAGEGEQLTRAQRASCRESRGVFEVGSGWTAVAEVVAYRAADGEDDHKLILPAVGVVTPEATRQDVDGRRRPQFRWRGGAKEVGSLIGNGLQEAEGKKDGVVARKGVDDGLAIR